jgi:hypothetical protein
MGGRGSGGRRIGAGRKKKSDLERAISGQAGPRGTVLQHPSAPAGQTAVAPVETFDAPAELQGSSAELSNLTSQLAFLRQAEGPGEPNPQIAELQLRVDTLQATAAALAVWHELAPQAFEARTLTPATTAAFVMLCRGVVIERALSASPASAAGPNHRGMMHRVATWMKDFSLAPFGKPMFTAEAAAPANPLDRFTKTRA